MSKDYKKIREAATGNVSQAFTGLGIAGALGGISAALFGVNDHNLKHDAAEIREIRTRVTAESLSHFDQFISPSLTSPKAIEIARNPSSSDPAVGFVSSCVMEQKDKQQPSSEIINGQLKETIKFRLDMPLLRTCYNEKAVAAATDDKVKMATASYAIGLFGTCLAGLLTAGGLGYAAINGGLYGINRYRLRDEKKSGAPALENS